MRNPRGRRGNTRRARTHAGTKPDLVRIFLEDEEMSNADAASTFFVANTSPPRWSHGEVEPTGTTAAILWTLAVLNEITKDWDRSEEVFVNRLEQKISEGLISVEALDSALKLNALLKKRLRNKRLISKVIIRLRSRQEQDTLQLKIERLEKELEEIKRKERMKLEVVEMGADEDEEQD
jgi:hypothetical protein